MLKNRREVYRAEGFTLIELLVVISIIGLLSSIILASLSSARAKAKDSSIQSTLRSAANQATIYSLNHTNNNALCSSADGFAGFSADLLQMGSSDTRCLANGGDNLGWAIEAKLVSDPSKYFCIDAKGHALYRTQFLFTPDCTVPLPP